MASLQKYAEYYARKGLAVFPCKPRGKEPLTSHGCKDATTDPQQVKAWWKKWPDANIGLATGEPSGIIVLDIDNHGEADGSISLREWESEFEPLPTTKTVITGSGGTHYWFRSDKDIRNRAGILPGIDVRGSGGYVIIPPSIHPNGNAYEWDAATEETPVAPIPEDLWALIRGERQEYGPAFELPAAVGKGQRNDVIFKLASSYQAKGLSDAALIAAVMAENQRVCDPPLSEKEVRTICESAMRYQKGTDKEQQTAAAVAAVEEIKAAPEDKVDFTQLELYQKLYNIPNRFERERQIAEFRERARKQKSVTTFNRMLAAYKTEYVQNKRATETLKTDFTDSPIEPLACGEWIADDLGIRRIREINGGNDTVTEVACPHPILPVERYINIDDGLERVVLAFWKDGAWKRTVCQVSKISDRGKIVAELADQGVAVTSGNAALLVQYLSDVINSNLKTIPQYTSIGRFGWMETENGLEFSPYTEGLKFDGERSSDKNEFMAVRPGGSYDKWKATVLAARKASPIIKILLAASCAAPMLQLTGRLPFFVHLWGRSGSGKTVSLLVALSIWGDPAEGKLLRTFNSTFVGMEREAAFAGNIPIGFNELQVTKGKTDFDQVIYMLCEGIGRIRGNINGGVDRIAEWRTVFLTNGEQPITNGASGGGAKSRVFEIECTEDLFEDASAIADAVRINYGHVGPELIRLLKDTPQEILLAWYNGARTELAGYTEKKQQDSGAMIMLGDKFFRMVTGAEDPLTPEEMAPYFTSLEEISLGARSYEFLTGWIVQNAAKFDTDSLETFGTITTQGANIICGVFNDVVTKQGWNPTAVKSELKQMGKLITDRERLTRNIKIKGKTVRCISVRFETEDEEG